MIVSVFFSGKQNYWLYRSIAFTNSLYNCNRKLPIMALTKTSRWPKFLQRYKRDVKNTKKNTKNTDFNITFRKKYFPVCQIAQKA